MNYTLHQLRVFKKVVENLSITKAAHELNMTQPAVSIQLKNLQDQFEIALTEVISRKLYVTEFGKELYQVSSKILEDIEDLDYRAKSHKGILSGKLKIAAVSTGKYIVPYFLTGFLKKYDSIDLNMDVTNRRSVIKRLSNNEIDFAFLTIKPDSFEVDELELLNNRLFLIGPGNSELDHLDQEKDMENIPLIFREEGSGTRLIMSEYFTHSKIEPRKKTELTSNEAVKQAVIAGLGYSILPIVSLKNELQNKDVKLISELKNSRPWKLVWLKNKKLSPVAVELINYLSQNKSKIIDEYFSWLSLIK